MLTTTLQKTHDATFSESNYLYLQAATKPPPPNQMASDQQHRYVLIPQWHFNMLNRNTSNFHSSKAKAYSSSYGSFSSSFFSLHCSSVSTPVAVAYHNNNQQPPP
ncbi:hypothetical protein SESBI_48976 [Sesbania bispinosa]|nr:hypothetical protein SESBI_48976 [Sesbania bispinosa]